MATIRGEQFSVSVEPFTIGQRGTGKWMSHFVIAATGRFLPTHDGSVQLTLGFQRGTSALQLGWRVVFYLLEVGVAADALWGHVVLVLGLSASIILAVFGIPWSLVSYVQGMRQAGKDWTDLLEMVRSSLHSHTVERA